MGVEGRRKFTCGTHLRSFTISQQALLLLQLLEKVLIGGLVNELVDGMYVALGGDVDATVLLANAVAPRVIHHCDRRAVALRHSVDLLLRKEHPVLMAVRRHGLHGNGGGWVRVGRHVRVGRRHVSV